VLDAGALVAIDRLDRTVEHMLRVLQREGIPLSTSAAVVAQVWRDGAKQANLARILAGCDVSSLRPADGRRAGELLGRVERSDVVDAHVALLVEDGDRVMTSDPSDLERLLAVRRVRAVVTKV
jgi:hypothetical protein